MHSSNFKYSRTFQKLRNFERNSEKMIIRSDDGGGPRGRERWPSIPFNSGCTDFAIRNTESGCRNHVSRYLISEIHHKEEPEDHSRRVRGGGEAARSLRESPREVQGRGGEQGDPSLLLRADPPGA